MTRSQRLPEPLCRGLSSLAAAAEPRINTFSFCAPAEESKGPFFCSFHKGRTAIMGSPERVTWHYNALAGSQRFQVMCWSVCEAPRRTFRS